MIAEIIACKNCDRPLPGIRTGRRPREYCNGACRVAYFRKLRTRPSELEMLRKQVADLQSSLIAEQQFSAELESKVKALEDQLASGNHTRQKKQRVPLPDGYTTYQRFADLHNVPQSKVLQLVREGHIHLQKGRWDTGKQPIDEALDKVGQAEFYIQACALPTFRRCDQCPHTL